MPSNAPAYMKAAPQSVPDERGGEAVTEEASANGGATCHVGICHELSRASMVKRALGRVGTPPRGVPTLPKKITRPNGSPSYRASPPGGLRPLPARDSH
ncbi:hypothetical protein M422DRAFT_266271 [Sphaerobolus stellatus SS14]|uniref:Unplaced genomic scaffold SPHSTscaffold_158, whole genome shotgun sequence n=1 Tax=Sphaerobolus stellatus (strain SS14) TaxID=990650 RepID=A0A0C9US61_SPHS4|nr:hypothetical protein M422DRAFT_266271 [Sphaerobolus stellatus SS14]